MQQVLKQAKAELVGWPLAATQVLERLIDRKALSGQASCAFVGVVVIPEQRAGSRELGGSVRFRNWEFFCTDTGEFKQRKIVAGEIVEQFGISQDAAERRCCCVVDYIIGGLFGFPLNSCCGDVASH